MTGFQITIARVMRERGYTQSKIAMLAGIPQTTMNNYITNKHVDPGMTNLIKIADGLKMSLDELVGRKWPVEKGDNNNNE